MTAYQRPHHKGKFFLGAQKQTKHSSDFILLVKEVDMIHAKCLDHKSQV